MTTHSSAGMREEEPHANHTTRTTTIINALKRRAQAVLNDITIDAQSRAIIRYALETNDPWLADLVRRADAGENLVDAIELSQIREIDDVHPNEEKIDVLADLICRSSDQSAAALLVLMARLENSAHPKALANQAKHLAFTRCGELNLYGMVDAQIASIESELLANDSLAS